MPRKAATQTVILQPVQSATWERDQRIAAAAARRRDPDAHSIAQANLDAMPKVLVVFEPNDDERRYGEAHLNKDGEPQYPPFECGYNGLRLKYPIGEEVEVPQVVWEIYAQSRRLPRHRTVRTATAAVWSRDIPDEGQLYSEPDFGR